MMELLAVKLLENEGEQRRLFGATADFDTSFSYGSHSYDRRRFGALAVYGSSCIYHWCLYCRSCSILWCGACGQVRTAVVSCACRCGNTTLNVCLWINAYSTM
ncbi:hypothetical protein Y032_0492g2426 [Ancylostoma ceylanicum]|uniref:Uncharacterized protein n=2 Tax=Ancylostoma ceylanicum TaxID=53326 RepID=A0A016WUM3_9BILA|nr:hypothetical protein Y032_0492g2426 [Ancylostoma ceylanicum]